MSILNPGSDRNSRSENGAAPLVQRSDLESLDRPGPSIDRSCIIIGDDRARVLITLKGTEPTHAVDEITIYPLDPSRERVAKIVVSGLPAKAGEFLLGLIQDGTRIFLEEAAGVLHAAKAEASVRCEILEAPRCSRFRPTEDEGTFVERKQWYAPLDALNFLRGLDTVQVTLDRWLGFGPVTHLTIQIASRNGVVEGGKILFGTRSSEISFSLPAHVADRPLDESLQMLAAYERHFAAHGMEALMNWLQRDPDGAPPRVTETQSAGSAALVATPSLPPPIVTAETRTGGVIGIVRTADQAHLKIASRDLEESPSVTISLPLSKHGHDIRWSILEEVFESLKCGDHLTQNRALQRILSMPGATCFMDPVCSKHHDFLEELTLEAKDSRKFAVRSAIMREILDTDISRPGHDLLQGIESVEFRALYAPVHKFSRLLVRVDQYGNGEVRVTNDLGQSLCYFPCDNGVNGEAGTADEVATRKQLIKGLLAKLETDPTEQLHALTREWRCVAKDVAIPLGPVTDEAMLLAYNIRAEIRRCRPGIQEAKIIMTAPGRIELSFKNEKKVQVKLEILGGTLESLETAKTGRGLRSLLRQADVTVYAFNSRLTRVQQSQLIRSAVSGDNIDETARRLVADIESNYPLW